MKKPGMLGSRIYSKNSAESVGKGSEKGGRTGSSEHQRGTLKLNWESGTTKEPKNKIGGGVSKKIY